MTAIYYIETNLVCCIVVVLFLYSMRKNSNLNGDRRYFNLITMLVTFTVVLCLSDMAAGVLRGAFFTGAYALIELSNIIYFLSVTAISLCWMLYVELSIEPKPKPKTWYILQLAPAAIILLACVTNPFTELLFAINSENLYVRGDGVVLHWIVTWYYFIYAAVRAALSIINERSDLKRENKLPLLYFIIAPTVASIVQMMFYGVSAMQVGITISICMICISRQNQEIFTDTLTGLSNRYALALYMRRHFRKKGNHNIAVLLLDVDGFKKINDTYGHLIGDKILKKTSDMLKKAISEVPSKVILCRYGGDEFIIILKNNKKTAEALKFRIKELMAEQSFTGMDTGIRLSVGTASGLCKKPEDYEQLIRIADSNMYKEKSANSMRKY